MMHLPNAANAVVPLEKLRDYCLSTEHPKGKHKARVFQAKLGIVTNDAEWLESAIRAGVGSAECVEGATDDFGQRYVVDLKLTRGSRNAAVRTTWIIRTGEDQPRLTSCFVL